MIRKLCALALIVLLPAAVIESGLLRAQQVEPELIIPVDDDPSAPYLFFSADAKKQSDPFRASYEKYVPSNGVLHAGESGMATSERQQLRALEELRRITRQLSELEARHPGTRAAMIADQLLLDASRIRVAPQDRFLPSDRQGVTDSKPPSG